MRRFDLGMSLNYCPEWGIVEAVREIFQNAYDAEIMNPANKMYFNYDKYTETLRIGNMDGTLTTKTLLLGVSGKRDDNRTIGTHGEGYKVATVVLTRLGKGVEVYNRSAKEVWTARVIKSRRYQTDVVVFDINKVGLFQSVPNHDLIFEITGITESEYEEIVKSNLHLQKDLGKVYECRDGRILMDEKYAGMLFVGGLYVTTSKWAKLGYDFKPDIVKLDRDRGFIDGIDLQFLCGKLICQSGSVDLIDETKKIWDGEYIRLYTHLFRGDDLSEYYEKSYKEFLEINGDDAIPVTDTVTFNRLKRNGFNAIMVDQNEFHYLSSASSYSEPDIQDGVSNSDLADKLKKWFETYMNKNSEGYTEGVELIEEVCDRLIND